MGESSGQRQQHRPQAKVQGNQELGEFQELPLRLKQSM